MIVVDTNIIAYRFIEGENTARAIEAARRDPVWLVPALWRHEFLNVLSYLCRREILSLDQARATWRDALRALRRSERPVDMVRVLELASQTPLSAYDAQYAVLARQLGVRCLTQDRKLLELASDVAVSLEALVG